MPYLGDDPKTLDAFMGLLAAVPSQAERLEVAASVMDDKSRLPEIPLSMINWLVSLGLILGLLFLANCFVLGFIIYRRQFWVFRTNDGVMIANVRVVEVLLKCLVVPSLMLNCLDHAAAQDGLRSYNRTLFFMMFRFVPLWISFWVYSHGCFVHLYIYRNAVGSGSRHDRRIVHALNASFLVVPTLVPIVQTVLAVFASLAFAEASVLATRLAEQLKHVLVVATFDTVGLTPADEAHLLSTAREVFRLLERAQHFITIYHAIWQVAIGLLCIAFFHPFLYHVRALRALMCSRLAVARTARTLPESTRLLWGSSIPGPDDEDVPNAGTSDEREAGIRIPSDSVSLLFMVSGSYLISFGFLVYVVPLLVLDFRGRWYWIVNYSVGSVLVLAAIVCFEVLYLWPPVARFIWEKSIQHRRKKEHEAVVAIAAVDRELQSPRPAAVREVSLSFSLPSVERRDRSLSKHAPNGTVTTSSEATEANETCGVAADAQAQSSVQDCCEARV